MSDEDDGEEGRVGGGVTSAGLFRAPSAMPPASQPPIVAGRPRFDALLEELVLREPSAGVSVWAWGHGELNLGRGRWCSLFPISLDRVQLNSI